MPTTSPRFVDIQSRLNVDSAGAASAPSRASTPAAYPDRPAGACGPDATTPVDAAQPLLPEPVLRGEVGHRVQRPHRRGGARRLLRVVRPRHGAVDPQGRRARHRHDAARRQARLSRGSRGRDAGPRRHQHAERRRGDRPHRRRLRAGIDVPAAGAGAARLHRRRARRVSLLRRSTSGCTRSAASRRSTPRPTRSATTRSSCTAAASTRREAVALARRLLRRRRPAADAVGRAPLRLRALRRAHRLLRQR